MEKKLEAINTKGMKKIGTFKFTFPCDVSTGEYRFCDTKDREEKGILFLDENGNMRPVFLLCMNYAYDDWFDTTFGIVIPVEDVYEIKLNEERSDYDD